MNKFHVFRLNFSGDMSKTHYFSNKFSKIAKRCVESPPSSALVLVTWSCVI